MGSRARADRRGITMIAPGWPRALFACALAIALVRAVCVAFGLRASVAILCGMHASDGLDAAFGALYVVSYFAIVIVAPVLAFAAALGAVCMRR